MGEMTILGELSFKETTLRLIRICRACLVLHWILCWIAGRGDLFGFGGQRFRLLSASFAADRLPAICSLKWTSPIKNKWKDLHFSRSGGSALNAALARGQ